MHAASYGLHFPCSCKEHGDECLGIGKVVAASDRKKERATDGELWKDPTSEKFYISDHQVDVLMPYPMLL